VSLIQRFLRWLGLMRPEPGHWWDDVWLHHCDNLDCGQMIYQGDVPEVKPDADGLYFCDQCGGPYPRLFDPPCGVCGRPRSIGCADRVACEFQTFADIGSCDPAAMAELMREEPDE
jgi:hypothetical protein